MLKKPHTLLIGAHMSISGGLEKAIERGASIGCTAIQIFTKSSQRWEAHSLTGEAIDAFQLAQKEFNIHHIITHANYLINLGSPEEQFNKKSVAGLIVELQRCEQLGIPYLVVHPGAALGSDEQDCLTRIAHNLDRVLEAVPGKTTILIENTAGQGSAVGYSFEHLATILENVSLKERVGVCFDTAHAFAAGYQFGTPEEYEALWEGFDSVVGLSKLKVIHVNDSKKECGSYVDRHEHIGKGKIGREAFRLLFNDARFTDVPKILETPKDSLEDDRLNIDLLKSLISTKE
jgi:deoxyribonuclease-4